ncbi:DMT family transporter [Acetobacter fallax]|uniref:EamA family transporter n=1 Tax=Acetobacter fallax TaxID=1737473 RepID=A0ABX0KDB9_9PROT|nr:EamA family transporter [Acetobacter fallax]NHO33995.1 EamA family transporter [Acetobacter fallax]NHO37529.1 EamA family transporter [Acetobacter fallax]
MSAQTAALSRHDSTGNATGLWVGVMILLWGLSWPAMKIAVGLIHPLWMATLRFATAGLCLFLCLAWRRELKLPKRGDWPILASIGGLQMMAFTALGVTAMQYIDASHAALLAYTTPLWGLLAGWILFREKPTSMQLVALLVGMSGIGLICSPLETDWHRPGALTGAGMLLLAAIGWSLVILHVRRHQWVSRPIDLAPWQMLFATAVLSVISLAVAGRPHVTQWTPELCILLLFIGPIATSFCFVISAEVGRRVSTFIMSNITLGVPVIGVIASAVFLHERITPILIVGLGLIIGSVIFATYVGRKTHPIHK